MTHLRTPLALAALLASVPAALSAQGTIPPASVQGPGTVLHCTASQLEGHAFQVGGLLMTPTSEHLGGLGNSTLELRIENPTAQFATVAWKDLAIVGADGEQFAIKDMWGGNASNPTSEVKIAPGAHLCCAFELVGSTLHVKFPAKVYFENQLLAEVTK